MSSCTPSSPSSTLPSVKNQPVPGGSGSSSSTRPRSRQPAACVEPLERAADHTRTSTESRRRVDPDVNRVERARRRPFDDAPVRVVGAAMARTSKPLRVGVPLHLATEVRAGRRQRPDVVAVANEEHGLTHALAIPAVRTRHAQHARHRRARLQVDERRRAHPALARPPGRQAAARTHPATRRAHRR